MGVASANLDYTVPPTDTHALAAGHNELGCTINSRLNETSDKPRQVALGIPAICPSV